MPNSEDKVNKVDIDSMVTKINQARNRWGLSNISVDSSNFVVGSHISNLKTWLNEANTRSGANVAINITNESAGNPIKAQHFNELNNDATIIYNHCSCDCDYCSCDCDYSSCSCNCDYSSCSCDSDTCSCDSDTCSCDSDSGCSCNCDYCSCDCDYCGCQGVCPQCPQCPDASCSCDGQSTAYGC